VPRALGISRGVVLARFGSKRPPQSLCRHRMFVGDGRNECCGRWRIGLACDCGRFIATAVSVLCLAESQPEWRAALGEMIGGERHHAVSILDAAYGGRITFRLWPASEGLYDNHSSAASATRTCLTRCSSRLAVADVLGPFRSGRHGEELARRFDVGWRDCHFGAIRNGGFGQSLGQHVRPPSSTDIEPRLALPYRHGRGPAERLLA